jgi:excisionase family DNA binding protein
MGNKADRDWYTVGEVSKLLGVAKSTIYRWMDSGKIESFRIGTIRRINKEKFAEFLRECGIE